MNLELIQFVGFDVEEDKLTPQDKYADLSEEKTHYSLMSNSLEYKLESIAIFKELKTDRKFLEARKIINKKDLLSQKEYDIATSEIANSMNISKGNRNDIENVINNSLKSALNNTNKMR